MTAKIRLLNGRRGLLRESSSPELRLTDAVSFSAEAGLSGFVCSIVFELQVGVQQEIIAPLTFAVRISSPATTHASVSKAINKKFYSSIDELIIKILLER